jgi:hypothetical protein
MKTKRELKKEILELTKQIKNMTDFEFKGKKGRELYKRRGILLTQVLDKK